MQFGMYLVDRGVISTDQFVEALKVQSEGLPPLGQIAIEEGMMSAREVFSVLRVQSDFTRERFGETAIDLKLLSRRDVAELLLLQGDRRMSFADALVRSGAIDQQECEELMQEYREDRERNGKAPSVEITRKAIATPTI